MSKGKTWFGGLSLKKNPIGDGWWGGDGHSRGQMGVGRGEFIGGGWCPILGAVLFPGLGVGFWGDFFSPAGVGWKHVLSFGEKGALESI